MLSWKSEKRNVWKVTRLLFIRLHSMRTLENL